LTHLSRKPALKDPSCLLLVVAAVGGCGAPEPEANATAAFPVDYADSYVEVRGCRKSADHELEHIRVLADPAALEPYRNRRGEFPDGAVVLKEQYEASDATCSGPISQWTVMQKDGSTRDRLGWSWQRVDADRQVVETNTPSCVNCHSACTGSDLGYDGTCAEP
jgi:hypothetical protein